MLIAKAKEVSPVPQEKTQTKKTAVSKARAEKIAAAKRKRRTVTLVILSLFLTFYIAVSLVIAAGVLISFNSVRSKVLFGVRTVKYNSSNRETVVTSASAKESNFGYGLYISADDLDKLCGFSFAGDKEKLTVIIPGSGDYMECYSGSSVVMINGTRIRLSQPVLNISGKFYFPVILAEEYLTGLKIEYSENDKLCRISLENGEDTVLGFRFKQTVSPSKIKQPD